MNSTEYRKLGTGPVPGHWQQKTRILERGLFQDTILGRHLGFEMK